MQRDKETGGRMNAELPETRNRQKMRSRTSEAPNRARKQGEPAERSVPDSGDELAGFGRAYKTGDHVMTAAFQQQEAGASDAFPFLTSTTKQQRAMAASHLAHDACNWLTVLRIYCDLLRGSGAVAAPGRTWMDELSNAVERGQGLVTSLLESAQIASTGESSHEEPPASRPKMLDLAVLLATRVPLFRELAGSAIDVQSKIFSSAQTTALREPEFDRILLNLVRNGIDAMPQGGRLTIELGIDAGAEDRPLVLRVSDTGNGIPADIVPRIFESGFSTKSTAQHRESGRGYGLAIVRELTRAAGGSVRVRSRIGEGACFTVEIPTHAAQATPRPTLFQRREEAPSSQGAVQPSARTVPTDNFGAQRKGTRVPC